MADEDLEQLLAAENDACADPDAPQLLAAWERHKERLLPLPSYQRHAADILRETVSAANHLSLNARLGADGAVRMEPTPKPSPIDPDVFEARLETAKEGARLTAEARALTDDLRALWAPLEAFEGAAPAAAFWDAFARAIALAERRLAAGGAPDVVAAGLHVALLGRAETELQRFIAHLTPAQILARWDAPAAAPSGEERALYGYALDSVAPLGLRRLARLYARAARTTLQATAAHLPDEEADAFRRETDEALQTDIAFSEEDRLWFLEAARVSVGRLTTQLDIDPPKIARHDAMNAVAACSAFETDEGRFEFGYMLPNEANARKPALAALPYFIEGADIDRRTRLLRDARIELFAAEDRAKTRAFFEKTLAFTESLLVQKLLAAMDDG